MLKRRKISAEHLTELQIDHAFKNGGWTHLIDSVTDQGMVHVYDKKVSADITRYARYVGKALHGATLVEVYSDQNDDSLILAV